MLRTVFGPSAHLRPLRPHVAEHGVDAGLSPYPDHRFDTRGLRSPGSGRQAFGPMQTPAGSRPPTHIGSPELGLHLPTTASIVVQTTIFMYRKAPHRKSGTSPPSMQRPRPAQPRAAKKPRRRDRARRALPPMTHACMFFTHTQVTGLVYMCKEESLSLAVQTRTHTHRVCMYVCAKAQGVERDDDVVEMMMMMMMMYIYVWWWGTTAIEEEKKK